MKSMKRKMAYGGIERRIGVSAAAKSNVKRSQLANHGGGAINPAAENGGGRTGGSAERRRGYQSGVKMAWQSRKANWQIMASISQLHQRKKM